jgi:hypothetical protein
VFKRAFSNKGFVFHYFLDRLFTPRVFERSTKGFITHQELLKALDTSTDLIIKRIFLERFLLTTRQMEKVCKKLNGSLSVPLNIIDLGGGI